MTLPNQPLVPTRRKIAINGSGGAVTPITSSIFCRYVEIVEDAATNQGLTATFSDDNFVTQYPYPAGGTITIGDRNYPRDHAVGLPVNIKDPAGNAVSVITYAKLISATATPTSVEVREYV